MPTVKKLYKPDQVLFKEGAAPASLYVILRGAVSIRKSQGDAFVEVARVHAGEVIGELSFFDHLPRSATAVALVEIEVLEIPFEDMDKLYLALPSYMKTIVASLADRLRKANEVIKTLQQKEQNANR